MSINVFSCAHKVLAASVAMAAVLGTVAASGEAYAAVNAASTNAAFTSPINNFNSSDFVNGIWRTSAGLSVPATTASIAAFKPGTYIRFADGQVRKITKVFKVGANLSVYVDGALLDGNKVGAPKTVSTVSDGGGVLPEVPDSKPDAGGSGGISYSALINNFTNQDWLNGTWRKSAGVSIAATESSMTAFKVGGAVTFFDGQVRKITTVQRVGNNLSVFMDGAVLDGNVIGHPNKLTTYTGSDSGGSGDLINPPTEPVEPPENSVTSALNNFTNEHWINGLWRQSAGFTIAATAANQKAFVVGASVKLADGQVRKITQAQLNGNNMSVFLDGDTLDSNLHGYPKTVSVISSSDTGDTLEPEVTPPTNKPGNGSIQLVGVNLSAAGFGAHVALPGVYGQHYFYPEESYYKKYADKGMNLVRLPFVWERIQPRLNTNLDSTELARLMQSLDFAQKHGVKVILDLHNYYRYYGKLIGTKDVPIDSFAGVWKQIAQKVVNHPAVDGYGLMNEPYSTNGLWPQAAEAAAKAIRTVDDKRWIYVAGDRYSSAYHFPNYNATLVNSPWMRDPKNNLVYEAHMYLDRDFSGNYADRNETFAANLGVERVKPFVEWLKANKLRGYIGEHGVPDFSPSAMVAMDNLLSYLRQNCIPMTYWAAGPWWGEYVLSLDTQSGSYRPQLPVLTKHAAAANSCTSIGPLQ
ncbi:MAG: glycoside hydrolase family 5 protein [Pseudomonas sp.]